PRRVQPCGQHRRGCGALHPGRARPAMRRARDCVRAACSRIRRCPRGRRAALHAASATPAAPIGLPGSQGRQPILVARLGCTNSPKSSGQ
ncbi:MAG: hypothetical protein ACK56I_06610, partial [bacterium]